MAGGILGLIVASISLVMVPFLSGIPRYGSLQFWQLSIMTVQYGLFGFPEFGSTLLIQVMFVWSIIGLVGSLLSLYCGFTLGKRRRREVVFIGLVGGFLLLLAFSWMSSLLVLGGAILGYVEPDAFSGSTTRRQL